MLAKADQKYVVCNADEGDSGTFADRMMMEGDPFTLIEGMVIAGIATGATKGFVYIRSEYPIAIHVMKDAVEIARAEGILPAPEANHAVRGAIDEALRCKEEGKSETILFNLCGHGHFDMQAYIDYFGGKLQDLDYDEGELAMALAGLPSVAAE